MITHTRELKDFLKGYPELVSLTGSQLQRQLMKLD